MLVIPMKVVHSLGEGRFQLHCMCDTDFAFVPGVFNSKEGLAVCPRCKAIWDGDETYEKKSEIKIRYYTLAIHPKGAEKDEFIVVATGCGVDLMHFSMPAIANVFSKIRVEAVTGVTISEITKEEYEEIEEKSMNSILDRLYNLLKGI